MKKWILIFFASTTFAALPPLAQSTRELQAMLGDARFYDSLGSGEVVKEILRTESGFLVLTQNYAMRVNVVYGGKNEQRLAGPIQFQLDFQEPVKF